MEPRTDSTEPGNPDTGAPERPLDPRFVPMQRTIGRLVALGITMASLVGVLIAWTVADEAEPWRRALLVGLWLAAAGALAWRAEFWPTRVYAHTRYRLDSGGLQIRSGVWWRTVTSVPRSRIQHTDVSQGPVERSYGLGTLIVYTAGTQHARVALAGLSHDTALSLRDELKVEHAADDSV